MSSATAICSPHSFNSQTPKTMDTIEINDTNYLHGRPRPITTEHLCAVIPVLRRLNFSLLKK